MIIENDVLVITKKNVDLLYIHIFTILYTYSILTYYNIGTSDCK